MEEKARAHVVISGRVQGVFFRMETKRAAGEFGVFGWVKNQRDGRSKPCLKVRKTGWKPSLTGADKAPPMRMWPM